MRLDKFLAHAGFGTRKEVKAVLKKKQVSVNGKLQTKGDFSIVPERDKVTVAGKEALYSRYVYLMLNKPAGVLSATEDSRQKTVLDLLDQEYAHLPLFPVGRLDKDTEGLLLLTNDGELAHFLLSPKKEVAKTYYAKVAGVMDEEDQAAFREGIILEDGYHCLPADLEIVNANEEQGDSQVLITIKEGKFHQVKRMVQTRQKEVQYLKRLSMGTLRLDRTLKTGSFRPLFEEEVELLETFLPENIKKERFSS